MDTLNDLGMTPTSSTVVDLLLLGWFALVQWLIHCHINHHTTNDNVEVEGGGGLMLIIEVQP